MRKEKENKRRRKLLPAMLAVALAAVMIVPMGVGSALASVPSEGTITVKVQETEDDFGPFGQDLIGDNAGKYGVVALYQIAEGTQNSSFETYDWDLVNGFEKSANVKTYFEQALAVKETDADTSAATEAYKNLAATAFELVANDPNSYAEALKGTANFGEPSGKIPAGMYLVVPEQVADGAASINENATITTEEYVYTFSPMLISVGTKADTIYGDEHITTAASGGPWNANPVLIAKASRDYNLGAISITKNLIAFETKPKAMPTFVFTIDAVKGDKTVYSDVVSIGFKDLGSQTRKIEGIPVGSTVTVTEVYSGHSYTLAEGDTKTKTTTVEADKVNNVAFTNDYDETWHGGGGIENQFTKSDAESSWDWTDVKSGTKEYNDVDDTAADTPTAE